MYIGRRLYSGYQVLRTYPTSAEQRGALLLISEGKNSTIDNIWIQGVPHLIGSFYSFKLRFPELIIKSKKKKF